MALRELLKIEERAVALMAARLTVVGDCLVTRVR